MRDTGTDWLTTVKREENPIGYSLSPCCRIACWSLQAGSWSIPGARPLSWAPEERGGLVGKALGVEGLMGCSSWQIIDPLARGRAFRMAEDADGCSVPHTPITPGATSLCSFSSSRSGFNRLPRRRKRESVAKMSFRAAAALVKVHGPEGLCLGHGGKEPQ